MGSYVLESEPQILELSYYTGLASKNSQGFGMWDLLCWELTILKGKNSLDFITV